MYGCNLMPPQRNLINPKLYRNVTPPLPRGEHGGQEWDGATVSAEGPRKNCRAPCFREQQLVGDTAVRDTFCIERCLHPRSGDKILGIRVGNF